MISYCIPWQRQLARLVVLPTSRSRELAREPRSWPRCASRAASCGEPMNTCLMWEWWNGQPWKMAEITMKNRVLDDFYVWKRGLREFPKVLDWNVWSYTTWWSSVSSFDDNLWAMPHMPLGNNKSQGYSHRWFLLCFQYINVFVSIARFDFGR